jgi:glycosyltransferase involved in cell wall biosynthesis
VNILFTVHHFLDVNAGAPGATYHLAAEYRALGHGADIYSFDNLPGLFSERERQLLFPYFVAAHLGAVTRTRRIDVVDASSGDAWLWSFRRRSQQRRSPLVVMRSHGLEHVVHRERMEEARLGNLHLSWKYPLYHGGWRLREVARSFRQSDLNLLLNRQDVQYLIDRFHVSPMRARVIPHGVPECFLGLPVGPVALDRESPISIAHIGRYDPAKGSKYLSEALSRVLHRNSQVKVGFFGCGCASEVVLRDYERSVHRQIDIVPGYDRPQLPKLLAPFQIKVFPTISEGFGLVLLEAMACGLAPVVTATPGPLEIVKDGYNAIVVPPRNGSAIAEALECLIADRQRLEELRRNAHRTAQAFSWPRIAEKTLQTYEAFMEARDLSTEEAPILELDHRSAAQILGAL